MRIEEASSYYHKRGKAKLHMQQRLIGILKLTGIAYWEQDADCRFNYFEGANIKLINYLYQTNVGKRGTDMPITLEFEDDTPHLAALLEKHLPFDRVIMHHVNKNGVEHYSKLSGYPVFNETGEFTGYYGSSEDITAEKAAEKKAERLSKLYATLAGTNEAILRACSVQELYQSVTKAMTKSGGFLSTAILTPNEGKTCLRTAAHCGGIDDAMLELPFRLEDVKKGGYGLAINAFATGQTCFSNDYLRDVSTQKRHDLARAFGMKSAVAIPLFQAGQTAAIMAVSSSLRNRFNKDTIQLIEQVRDNISFALKNLDLESQRKKAEADLKETQEQLRLALEVANAGFYRVNLSVDKDEIFNLDAARKEPINTSFNFPAIYGYPANAVLTDAQIIERVHPDDLIRTQELMKKEFKNKKTEHNNEYRITRPDGAVRWLMTKARITYDEEGSPLHLTGVVMDITDRKEVEERNQYMATHDSLTGLPNRLMFRELLDMEIELAQRYENGFAVLFIDLDEFKPINDRLGHEAGDNFLMQVARELKKTIRSSDIFARFGGDEFFVLLREINNLDQVSLTADKLREVATRPYNVNGYICRVSISIGVACYPGDGEKAETLIKHSDYAMYEAKRNGKNNCRFYSENHFGKTKQGFYGGDNQKNAKY